ncbi:jerky protein homolog-like [Culex pipiens pallens]|uniref:jerky protein homolog-like n=1 Tax=Culex pipiens pallens TaxID=42434 RepID=UPI001952C657|nr:jerky protein homolog-like [Culex pipiens pallens]
MASKRKPLSELNISDSTDQPKKKHVTLSLDQKVRILDSLLCGSQVSAVSKEFNIARTTVLNIKKQEESIRLAHQKFLENGVKERRTVKTAKLVTLEDCLFVWILQERLKKHILLPDIVRAKGEQMFRSLKEQGVYDEEQTFTASNGWYDRFRKRYGLKMAGIKGECASSDTAAFEKFKARLMQLIIDNNYEKFEIYNADESALFVKLLPSRTLIMNDEDIAEGRKVIKSRVTFMPCSNIDGSNKLPLMLIGTAENPRTLPKDKSSLPVYYKGSKKAWMNRLLFKEWFHGQFVPSVRKFSAENGREPRALLVLDNCSAHHDGGDVLESDDGKIKVIFLPPNVTALGQPMDQGVINAVKKRYKKKLMLHLLLDDQEALFEDRLKNVSLRQTIDWLDQAWTEISSKTIEGSWRKLFDEFPTFVLDVEDNASLDQDVLALVQDTARFFPDDPTNDEIKDWLNDKVCDKNGNLIVGDCDVYTDQEIIDSVLARDDKDSFDFDEDWLIEEPVDESTMTAIFSRQSEVTVRHFLV